MIKILVATKKILIFLIIIFFLFSTTSCGQKEVSVYIPEVINTYPHNTNAFTQGLLFHDDKLYESTGVKGHSTLREVDLETGEVTRHISLANEYFAEGLALVNDKLIQLTWQSERAFVYYIASFKQEKRFSYEGEGWGLCFDGSDLYMSDGSSIIKRRNPENFEVTKSITVTLHGNPVRQLNELECVGQHIYANIWQTDTIVQIDKKSGKVVAEIDAVNLLSASERQNLNPEAVLNGIAYNAQSDTFYLTGKLWPKLFEVRFIKTTQ